jgi:hypothetical protein
MCLIIGSTVESDLLIKALKKYFNGQPYFADCCSIEKEGIQPITFKQYDYKGRVVKSLTVHCNVLIEEVLDEYMDEYDKWAILSIGNLEDFLKIYGELVK